ncbi:MAG TPA: SAM-dependent methyltransferase [Streptosporangiaceae bacterium]|nr:SAM-dependent methyltransferase [Streptosporangiaceae bacterium]
MTTQDFTPDDPRLDDPFEIDISVPHPARRYNYLLDGTDNFEVDRISARAVEAAFPTIRISAQENRRFLRRAVTYLATEAGIRQFLDIGTGIPSADNVHEVAQRVAPDARVVYVDNDPIVLAHSRRLLAGTPLGTTAYLHADLRQPDAILAHPELRVTLDLGRPVALMLIAVLHFLVDDADPYGLVARLTAALPSGSYLVISHATTDFMPRRLADDVDKVIERDNARSKAPGQLRNRAAFARFFDGMDLVPPGITSITEWRNSDPPDERPSAADVSVYGAVARIP